MRDENRRARLFKQGCESVRAHIIIELARVRSPGALELIDGLFGIGEGRALKYRRLAVFIRANAAEHEHRMVGIHRIGCIRVLAIIVEKPSRRKIFWNPSRPSGVDSHVRFVCAPPCSKISGYFFGCIGF